MEEFRRGGWYSLYDHLAAVRAAHSYGGQRSHGRSSIVVAVLWAIRFARGWAHLLVGPQTAGRGRAGCRPRVPQSMCITEALNFPHIPRLSHSDARPLSDQQPLVIFPRRLRAAGIGARDSIISTHSVTSRDHDEFIDRVRRLRRARRERSARTELCADRLVRGSWKSVNKVRIWWWGPGRKRGVVMRVRRLTEWRFDAPLDCLTARLGQTKCTQADVI